MRSLKNSESGSARLTRGDRALRCRRRTADELSILDLLEIGLVRDALDPLLRRYDFVIARHYGDALELQPLCEVHVPRATLPRSGSAPSSRSDGSSRPFQLPVGRTKGATPSCQAGP